MKHRHFHLTDSHTSPRITRLYYSIILTVCFYCIGSLFTIFTWSGIIPGAALGLYVFAPLSIFFFLFSQPEKVKNDYWQWPLIQMTISLLLFTLALFVVTDWWNPDHFVYSIYMPSIWEKILLIINLQLPWIGLGLIFLACIWLCVFLRKNTMDTPAAD